MKFQIPRYKGFKVGIFRISPIVSAALVVSYNSVCIFFSFLLICLFCVPGFLLCKLLILGLSVWTHTRFNFIIMIMNCVNRSLAILYTIYEFSLRMIY